MKVVLRSIAALIVLAAIAVPFVQNDFNAFTFDDSSANQQGVAQLTKHSRGQQQGFPPVKAELSSKTRKVPQFSAIYDVNERKRQFFAYLLPAIEETNQRIQEQREYLMRLAEKHTQGQVLTQREAQWLDELADYYRVDESDIDTQFDILIARVDIVPAPVVLIQSANESGWGTSRFAVEGLNFFGQWCWTPGCGMIPAARPAGQSYEVRSFESMESSVVEFVRNLNTHFAYKELRAMRLEERMTENTVSSATIIAGLISYSERGQDYIDELNQMIRINRPIIEEVQIANANS